MISLSPSRLHNPSAPIIMKISEIVPRLRRLSTGHPSVPVTLSINSLIVSSPSVNVVIIIVPKKTESPRNRIQSKTITNMTAAHNEHPQHHFLAGAFKHPINYSASTTSQISFSTSILIFISFKQCYGLNNLFRD
jgi:hypothetical protein